MKQVTIKDVARAAGVSYSTVSRSLTGSPEISEKTRQRIQRADGSFLILLCRFGILQKANVHMKYNWTLIIP